ncbi:Wall-associated receptor kinase, C-terminal [Parasponia andersonii]|uniref:Wall-associated receptor kinase, C-terminal n=1 Tax=Parasponia andersonii TaxID=3476 RepID=A0A2P5AQZ3_PARAD|nr:Wall-associated receptor kinase, C-terminal [Parasponia andersonii]
MLDGPCSRQVQNVNTTTSRYLQYGLDVHFPSTVKNLTLFYGCKTPEAAYFPYKFSCHEKSETVFYANDSLLESLEPNLRPGSCSEVIWVPIFPDALDKSLSSGDDGMEEVGRALSEGFEVIYPESEVCKKCEDSGGICGYESSTPDQYFRCFCRDGVNIGLCIPRPRPGMFSFHPIKL